VIIAVPFLQLQGVNENLNTYVSNVSASQPAPTLYHTLQRHNEILQDYKQEFNRIKVCKYCHDESKCVRIVMTT
jgi:hypothetical protein